MKRTSIAWAIAGLIALAGLIILPAFAQSDSTKKPAQESGVGMMNCPMMGMMSGMRGGDMTEAMPQRMAGMFAMSSEEVAKSLAEKKAALGLSDAQVKSVADLLAAAQKQKAGEKMRSMMGQMQSGGKCPCMQSEKK